MITVRRANERGTANLDWLDTQYSFSFANYYDPNYMGFGSLRVINEDKIQPAKGFPTHGHQDMEILTYVLSGALEHKDSLGNGSIIRPGEVQRMSAGTGIMHSEFNASKTDPVHLLQIWIVPEQKGLNPSYEQKYFDEAQKQAKLCLIASRNGQQGSVTLHQDVNLYATILAPGEKVSYSLASKRQVWVQVTCGIMELNGQELAAGDGASISSVEIINIQGISPVSEILLFDLAQFL